MLTLDLILGSVKHSEIPWMLMEKIWYKIYSLPADGLFLLELCGPDSKGDWEAEGSMLALRYSQINSEMPFQVAL